VPLAEPDGAAETRKRVEGLQTRPGLTLQPAHVPLQRPLVGTEVASADDRAQPAAVHFPTRVYDTGRVRDGRKRDSCDRGENDDEAPARIEARDGMHG
jgi:hypothetical protein